MTLTKRRPTPRLVTASIFGALIALAQQAAPQPAPRVRELAKGVFFWQGDRATQTQTNVGWVLFDDFVFVIDANFPWGAREIVAEIRKTTSKPIRYVFDTHYHADHAYGNAVFEQAGATILSSAACAEESRRKGARDVENQAKGRANEPLVHPALGFERGLVIDDGTMRVELTHVGPAHTQGDAVAYLPKEKILFVGDLAVNWTLGNNVSDVDADHGNWVQALDRLSQWDASLVVPGHGLVGTRETLIGQRGYLAAMLAAVRAGIRDGKSADEVAKTLDLGRFQPFGADAQRTASQARSMYRRIASVVSPR